MRISIMGAGSQGCFYGACLAKAGNDVTFIARGDNLKALWTNGVTLRSTTIGNVTLPVKATNDPRDAVNVDLVMLCVKYYDLEEASRQMAPMIGDNTVVIPVMNGIDVAEKVGKQIGVEHVLGGVSWVSTKLELPGVVNHGGDTRLIFGELGGGESERARSLAKILRGAEIQAELNPDIKVAIWDKFCFNAPANGAMALVRLPVGLLRKSPEAWAMVRKALVEADEVAKACGVRLPAEHIDTSLKFSLSAAPWVKSSMLQDLEAGRRLELEALTGAIVRLGREKGVPTPVNETIYAALKPYENGAPAMPMPS